MTKFRAYVTVEEAEGHAAELAPLAETVPDPQRVAAVTRDPNDDYLVALAREAAADARVVVHVHQC